MVDCKTCEYENVCEMPDFVRNNLKMCKTHTPKVKQTNADRIRSMTDEELAEFISSLVRNADDYLTSEGNWLIWLQSEAE